MDCWARHSASPCWPSSGRSAPRSSPATILALGYLFALFGFLLGVGAFRFWLTWALGREVDEDEEHAAHGTAGDWRRYFKFTTDHKVIGVQYLVTAFVVFFIAGLGAMFMRFELAQPGIQTDKDTYNTIMSTHGAMMVTVALVSIIGGLGITWCRSWSARATWPSQRPMRSATGCCRCRSCSC